MRSQGEGVLCFAADTPLRGHLLGRQAHPVGDADVFVVRKDLRVEGRFVAAHGHHAHAFSAASNHDVGFTHTDAVGGHLQRREARGAKAVHRDTAHAVRQPCNDHGAACHVGALFALGERAANDGVFNRFWVEAGHLQQRAAHGSNQQVIGPRIAEITARCLADGRACGGNDVGFLYLSGHVGSLVFCVRSAAWCQLRTGLPVCSMPMMRS